MFVAFMPSAYGQSFITIKPPVQPSAPGVVTPAFVPNADAKKTGIVPAHAVQWQESSQTFNVIPVAAQQPGVGATPGKDEDQGMLIRTDMPGPQRLFIRESEDQFWDRYSNELAKESRKLYLPEKAVVSTEPYRPRTFEPIAKHVEPSYVVHRRLYFEQPNFERSGWDLGILTPAVNLGVFYYDAALLPYHFWSDVTNHYECSAGKCLPGDPAPLLLYRERYSTMGIVGQLGTVAGLVFLFP